MTKMEGSSINGVCLTLYQHTYKGMQIDPQLSSLIKMESTWIKDLNIKLNKVNWIQEKVKDNHERIGTTDNIMNRTSMTQVLKSINECVLMKLKCKGHCQKNKVTVYGMGKDHYQSYICYSVHDIIIYIRDATD